jgi:hypothetical protein
MAGGVKSILHKFIDHMGECWPYEEKLETLDHKMQEHPGSRIQPCRGDPAFKQMYSSVDINPAQVTDLVEYVGSKEYSQRASFYLRGPRTWLSTPGYSCAKPGTSRRTRAPLPANREDRGRSPPFRMRRDQLRHQMPQTN